MQNIKLAALAILGAGFLAFGSMTSTGCSSTDDGGSGAAGEAGSGGSTSASAAAFAAAIGADSACSTCLAGLTGTVDAGGQSVTCDGVATKCDTDQACQNLIATTAQQKTSEPSSNATCWFGKANTLLGENATAASDDFYACATLGSCATACGNLSNETSSCQLSLLASRLARRTADPREPR